MSIWRAVIAAIVIGVLCGILIDEQPKSLIVSLCCTLLWLVAFDR